MAKKLLMGNEAFACAALEAGVGVVAGYPGTPSSELIETVAARVADGSAQGVHVEWSTNEKAALELVAGASYAGARTLFTCKQVGLNVASDALMSLNYVGIEGGCVLYVADDPGPISSQTEQDTRRFASFAKVPVLDPADVEQGMEMMRAAFDLSERYRTPVIVRATTRVCHSSTFVEVDDVTYARPGKGFKKDDNRWVIFPSRAYRGHKEVNERLKWIEAEFSGSRLTCADTQSYALQEGQNTEPASSLKLDKEQLLPEVAAGLGNWDTDGSRRKTALSSVANAENDTAGADAPAFSVMPPCNLSRFNPLETGLSVGAPAASQNPSAGVLGIVCGGVSTAYVREALAIITQEDATHKRQCLYGPMSYALMQVGTPFPFPAARANNFIADVNRIIVFEELDHVIEDELLRVMGLRAAEGLPVVRVVGRRSGGCLDAGENTVEDIAERLRKEFDRMELETQGMAAGNIEEELSRRHSARLSESESGSGGKSDSEGESAIKLPVRPPVLCAGCPHRGAFYASKQAVRKMKVRAVFSGDIGCYTLGNAQPLDAVDTCLCMGAGITMAQGLGIVEPGVKQIAFVGDSTFFASGLTGIANAAYNGHDVTVCVLDNSITAMTGGQPHPGIGRTLMGTSNEPLSIEAALGALGVKCIEHANPHHLDEGVQAVTRALEFEGVSAVIFRAPCVNLVKPQSPIVIDAAACTGCKRCITSIGCPAISFERAEGTSTQEKRRPGIVAVNTTLCTGCGLCAQLCPFGCIALPHAPSWDRDVCEGVNTSTCEVGNDSLSTGVPVVDAHGAASNADAKEDAR